MSTENLKTLYQQYIEDVWSGHDVAAMDKYFTEDHVDHDAPPGQGPGLAGLKATFAHMFSAFPDCRVEVQKLVAEDDTVVARVRFSGTHKGVFFGIPPTGRYGARTSTHILKVRDGKLSEHWGNADDLGMMMQLGVIQMPGY